MDTYLFDLDGTLVDSHKPIFLALNGALRGAGLDTISATDISRHVGPPLQVTLEHLLDERGEDISLIPAIIEAYRTEYRVTSVELAISYSGIPEMLESLDGSVTLGVVTSKPIQFALPILRALEFTSMMQVIEGPDISEVEPKTVTLERAIGRLGTMSPARSITMIGDRRHDIEAGRAHGTHTIGVTWGFGTEQELMDAGADMVVDHPAAICDLVE